MSDQKLEQILCKLEDIDMRLKKIEESCLGMDGHIGFVESIYTTLRSPLNFLSNQVNMITGTTRESLPVLKLK
uniref:Uncharacterized protein n=1 Tax=viral metagenome TaxID=1070528 RepID=A0A6C0LVL4_9ZZZZ